MNALYNLPAPAKLNLFLHVVGQRDDGKHLLESVFVLIDRQDLITLKKREDNQIVRTGDVIGSVEQDLCVRAAQLLKQTYNVDYGVDIHVQKRIPAGAGMGGGSSDAATTLVGLNKLWNLGIKRQKLEELGLSLGADVPFFIRGQNAWVEGIGEIIEPIAIEPSNFYIIYPNVNVPTGKIFSSKDLTRDSKSMKIRLLSKTDSVINRVVIAHNDLQSVATQMEPVIAQALKWFSEENHPRMTGSGSAVFGFFFDEEPKHFRSLPEGWLGFKSKSLVQHPLADWLDD